MNEGKDGIKGKEGVEETNPLGPFSPLRPFCPPRLPKSDQIMYNTLNIPHTLHALVHPQPYRRA